VEVPTGGMAQAKPASGAAMRVSRSGEMPGPTVTVRMEEGHICCACADQPVDPRGDRSRGSPSHPRRLCPSGFLFSRAYRPNARRTARSHQPPNARHPAASQRRSIATWRSPDRPTIISRRRTVRSTTAGWRPSLRSSHHRNRRPERLVPNPTTAGTRLRLSPLPCNPGRPGRHPIQAPDRSRRRRCHPTAVG
jgi:hypothetical protein